MPTNTYRAKKLIRPMAMKIRKFYACPNHYILYRGQYADFHSCPRCGTSWYKSNAGCRAEEEGPSRGPKKKKTGKKQMSPPEDEEEEGYT